MNLRKNRETRSLIHKPRDYSIKNKQLIPLLYLGLLLFGVFTLSLGRYPISIKEIIDVGKAFLNQEMSQKEKLLAQILITIRLPRIIAAIITGSCLSAAGAAMQATFKNPMVSPSLLGVSSGSAFGAALGILLHFNHSGIQIVSFAFGLTTVLIVYSLNSIINQDNHSTTGLILTGIVVSSLFTSLISLLKYVADPYESLPAITFWLMGSLNQISLSQLLPIILPVALGLGLLLVFRWRITILSFGQEEASSVGLNYKLTRIIIVLATTMMTASVVSISGLIGFVGLIVPHITRMLVGENYTRVIPASIAIGGIYLLVIDTISRSLFSAEIPLGILTSIIGTPFFIILLIHNSREYS